MSSNLSKEEVDRIYTEIKQTQEDINDAYLKANCKEVPNCCEAAPTDYSYRSESEEKRKTLDDILPKEALFENGSYIRINNVIFIIAVDHHRLILYPGKQDPKTGVITRDNNLDLVRLRRS